MSVICPTITAENPHTYREQMQRVSGFASRIHIDLMDGIFAPNKSLGIENVWLAEGLINDIHVMYQQPEEILSDLIALQPNLVSVHAESDCNVEEFARDLHTAGIKCGLAVFPETTIESVATILPHVDQLLIFSGNLGYQGGSVANLALLEKIPQAREINSQLEFAWDGGVNHENVVELASKGVTVINAGGYIHHASNPEQAYRKLTNLLT
ncbi:MAG TPA: hypothetical protein PJ984_00070 [Candidatus Saccharibacteria bacterium]|jgi:ribulose-phosphate 3-epimerase|nr:ribulose-phosphate 3-epimerase [Patescibacteria group bacterium]HMS30776.1 hypothetical protein [Candidatus Saccharibacteria bacterium]